MINIIDHRGPRCLHGSYNKCTLIAPISNLNSLCFSHLAVKKMRNEDRKKQRQYLYTSNFVMVRACQSFEI